MKQVAFIAFLVSICAFKTIAQPKLGLDGGLKIGANFSQIDGKYWDNGFKANFLAGVFLGVHGPKIGVQLEALFVQSTYNTGDGFHDVYGAFYNNIADSAKKGSFKVNNLNVPVLLTVKVIPMVSLQLGPQFSSVLSVSDKETLIKDPKELFKSSWDGVIGLQVNLPIKLNLGARYVIGLSDVNNTGQVDDAWKNKTLQVHIGYTIL
jgi:hypothetical protein